MALSGHQRSSAQATALPVHVCGECRSKLVQPLDWEEADGGTFRVLLRCPNCWWSACGTYGGEALEAFDQELEEGTEVLIASLRLMAQANMAEAVDGFVRALWADAVLPEDF